MPKKLKITLWVAIGLAVIALSAIIVMTILSVVQPSSMTTAFNFPYIPFAALLFACGILIVYWTRKTIKQVALKRYLLLAGASAIGILFFHCLHFLLEELMVMGLFVCPVALIVGAALALRFKSASKD